jgi:hypothetical protein
VSNEPEADFRQLFMAAVRKAGGRLVIDDSEIVGHDRDTIIGLHAGHGATEYRIFPNVPEPKPSERSRDKRTRS